jgi:tetratricopeptide (TPR) repeat protein
VSTKSSKVRVVPSDPPPSQPSPRAISPWKARAALVALVLVAYCNAFGLGAALDGSYIVFAEHRIEAATLSNVKTILTTDYWWPRGTDRLYRPLTTLSFLFNYSVLGNGSRAAGYHAVNIALHAINVLLVFALASLLFKRKGPAWFAAALWAVHPVGVETVTNIAGRADLLATAGLFGALLVYAKMPEGNDGAIRRRVALFGLAVLALFAKETGAILIPLMLAWELSRGPRPWPRLKRRAPEYLVAAAAGALYALTRMRVLDAMPWPAQPFMDNPLMGAGFWEARWTAVRMIGLDFLLLLWPAGLCSDRSFDEIRIAAFSDPWAWISLLAVIGILLAVILRRGKDPELFWAAGLFGITLLPVSNLVILIGATTAERFLYLPAIGFAIAAAALVWRFAPPRAAAAILGVAIALCAGRTFARNPVWDNNLTLSAHDSKVAPRSFRLHQVYGEALFAQGGRNLDSVISEFEKAWEILSPLPPEKSAMQVPATLAAYYTIKGDRAGAGSAEGQRWYNKAVPLLLQADAIYRRDEVLEDEAQRQHGKPEMPHRPSAGMYLLLGKTYNALRRYPEAVEAYRYARTIDPMMAEGYDAAANVYVASGDPDMAAVVELERVLATGASPTSLGALAQFYAKLPDGGCAVTSQSGIQLLNAACPKVQADLCRALPEIAQTFADARQPARATEFRKMLAQQSCPSH